MPGDLYFTAQHHREELAIEQTRQAIAACFEPRGAIQNVIQQHQDRASRIANAAQRSQATLAV